MLCSLCLSSSSSVAGTNTLASMWSTAANGDSSSGQKRSFVEGSPLSGHDSSSFASNSYTRDQKRWLAASKHPPKTSQLTLVGTKHDPLSSDRMDIAVADFIFSNALPISLVECTKFQHLIKCARFVPPRCGAGQGGTLGNIPNPRAGPSFSFFRTKSYIRRSRDVTRREAQTTPTGKTGKNTATMVAEPPSSPATWR